MVHLLQYLIFFSAYGRSDYYHKKMTITVRLRNYKTVLLHVQFPSGISQSI